MGYAPHGLFGEALPSGQAGSAWGGLPLFVVGDVSSASGASARGMRMAGPDYSRKIPRDGEAHKDTFLAYMQRPMPTPIAWRFRHRIGAVPAYLHDPGCGNEYGGGGGPRRARPQAPAGNRTRPRDRTAIPAVVIVSARHHRGWPITDGQGSRRAGLQPRADQGRASPPQGPAINGSAGVGRDAPRRWHRRSSRVVSQRA